MNHALILPILLPAVVGAVLVIAARYDRVLARVLSLASMVLMLAIALGLFVLASDGSVRTYALGAWPAPFGIVLALARLAGPVVLLSGPEGGLSPQEEAAALAAGFAPITLGPRVLRAETAPLAALALLDHG